MKERKRENGRMCRNGYDSSTLVSVLGRVEYMCVVCRLLPEARQGKGKGQGSCSSSKRITYITRLLLGIPMIEILQTPRTEPPPSFILDDSASVL